MNKANLISGILTCIGAAGVIATAVMAAKATPKACELLKEAEELKGEELTTVEKVKVGAPAYIPAIITGAATVVCVLGAGILNQRAQANIAAGYALLDRSYQEYKKKVEELYGEEVDAQVQEAIANDIYEDHERDIPVEDDEKLFFDFNAMEFFNARMEDVLQKGVTDDGLEYYIVATPFAGMYNQW
jgi:prefoldin subunit 5